MESRRIIFKARSEDWRNDMEIITGIINRLSKYEWFNRLFPGVFFVLMAKVLRCPMFSPSNWLETLGMYMLWGELTSRVGALVLEPLLKYAHVVRFSEYEDYQDYQEQDKCGADMLTTNANFARTLCALGLLLELLRFSVLLPRCGHVQCATFGWRDIAVFAWTALFLFAYCRQVNFLVARIEKFKAQINHDKVEKKRLS